MRALKKMLVIVDTRQDKHLALARARLLAKATGATIHALAPNPRASEASLKVLETLIKPLQDEGLEVIPHEQWHNNAVETIIHVRQAEGCDLVVKQAKRADNVAKVISTPEDWSLLRKCRVPVLMVKHTDPWAEGKILAAIDANPNDSEHQVLNEVILEYAAAIAGVADAECHIASAHPAPMLSSSDPDKQTQEGMRFSYQAGCKPFADRYEIPAEDIHVEEGPAETLIPAIAKRIDADLVVMGTVARTGIKGALMGNTAELLLGAIECDVLTLKPRDIMEPLEQTLYRF